MGRCWCGVPLCLARVAAGCVPPPRSPPPSEVDAVRVHVWVRNLGCLVLCGQDVEVKRAQEEELAKQEKEEKEAREAEERVRKLEAKRQRELEQERKAKARLKRRRRGPPPPLPRTMPARPHPSSHQPRARSLSLSASEPSLHTLPGPFFGPGLV
jgi:hypothetical protein